MGRIDELEAENAKLRGKVKVLESFIRHEAEYVHDKGGCPDSFGKLKGYCASGDEDGDCYDCYDCWAEALKSIGIEPEGGGNERAI